MTRAIVLEYHDVVERDDIDGSGFPGHAAGSYKLEVEAFDAHLEALSEVEPASRALATDPTVADHSTGSVMLTFDDGGRSAITVIADRLESHGWRGHFFVATDFIGQRTFLDAREIRALVERGHVIGSHSCSHPLRMSACDDATLAREWTESFARLSDITGQAIMTGSVPGGGYTPRVARFASAAGARALFTSEPISTVHLVARCLVFGRFTLRRTSSAALTVRLARGAVPARLRQWVVWNTKKALKASGGRAYLGVRSWLYRDVSAHPTDDHPVEGGAR